MMMAARQIPHRLLLLRNYSRQRQASKLWIKLIGGLPTQVSIKGCTDVDDFAKELRQELNTNCLVSLFTSLDKDPIKPGLNLNDLLQNDEDFKNNTNKTPLFVKLCPVIPDTVAPKTIYIAETDYEGDFTGHYMRTKLYSDHDVMMFREGLIHPSSPDHLLLHFDELKDGEKYIIYSHWPPVKFWQYNEAIEWKQRKG